ncbi:sigma-54-dependent transcriptional regulator [Limnoglobus roseus]|uniref:DNA-binding transcriptional regulator NtrC n=1 Tax=Limnoglobus roseus TaxID=2598579 RepID=A0A5C1AJ69_9BACT|nr:sigma-54 dependent transcriptional regulator [Limnoglobus roseus]QEL17752.1 sigma-54-dependent Fis family transcriptional regulator [Limnoglobus roseus]
MPTLLLVDDEPNVLYTLELGLAADGVEIVTARTGKGALRAVRSTPPDAVILDVKLPDMSGLDVFDAVRAIDPRLPVVIITAHGTTETAIEATKRGAFEYLLKPVDLHHLQGVVARAFDLRRMRAVPAVLAPDGADTDAAADAIVGRSPAMQEVFKAVGRVTAQDVPVLILGESGTGKELVARAIYQHSRRADKPFLAINCAAIPEALLESELFGHERGAFTGADRQRVGKFEQADGGTLFLDEVGDMAPATQAKMLRLLQEQRFERVGSSRTIAVDVRVIAATNRDLEVMVAAGTFRGDLLYRLNGFTLHLPPLRDRKDDLPLLADHFRRAANHKLGKAVRAFAPDAVRLIEAHDWPGNVRELQSAVRFAVVQAVGDVVVPDDLPRSLRGAPVTATPAVADNLDVTVLTHDLLARGEEDIYAKVGRAVDRAVLDLVLRHAGGNQVTASQLLGISRTTLRAKLQALGLVIEKQVRADG